MILGLASPTYSGVGPVENGLRWLLERCAEYDLRALEASLPDGAEEARQAGRQAADMGVTWVGYWSTDFVDPEDGPRGLLKRAAHAFDMAVEAGVRTLVIFGAGSEHNRFTRQPPLGEQLQLLARNMAPVAAAAADRGLQLALLPHLDYRGHEMVGVIEAVGHPALKMAFDTSNPFPVCEEPTDAARAVLPQTAAVALKDVQIYPHRSNQVTIWGAPLGQGSVDFDRIFPLLGELLPDLRKTTLCIKLRLPPDSAEHGAWMQQSLEFVRHHPLLLGLLE